MALTFVPHWPLWGVLALAGAGLVWALALYLTLRFPLRRTVRWALGALRLAVLAALAICLLNPLGPRGVDRSRQPVVLLVDASASMAVRDGPAGEARWRAAGTLSRALTEALSRRFELRLMTFGLAPRETARLPDEPREPRTDIPAALAAALARGPAAVFLVTDGADNAPTPVEPVLRRLADRRAPVHTLLTGAARPIRDVAVARLTAARKVALKTHVHVEVTVLARDLPEAAATTVRLMQGPKTLEAKPLTLESGARRVTFDFTPERKGLLAYAVTVDPLPGEVLTENNTDEFVVDCDRRRLRVLYMEGTQYRREGQTLWEHQFLAQALEEDPDISVTVLFKDDVAAARQAGLYWVRHAQHGFPRSRRELFQYDVIISSDIDIEYFSQEQLANLVDFVGRRGGGFVMIGGYTAFGAGGYDESIIDKILPVDMQGREDGYFEDYENQFTMKLTPDGLRHPICRLDPDPVKNLEIWKKVPALGGFNYVLKAKDLATTLAVHPDRMNRQGNYVILAVQQYGRGRTMAFTSDTTAGWGAKFETDWGEKGDNAHFRKFWQNAIRWLAAYRIEEAPRALLLSCEQNQYALGDRVRITARVLDEEYEPTDEAALTARVNAPDGALSVLAFSPIAGERGRFEATLRAEAAGRYVVRGTARRAGRTLGEDALSFLSSDTKLELRDYSPDRELLARIAETSGGRVFGPGESGEAVELAGALRPAPPRESARYATLWDRWWVLVLLVAALTAEWYVRRRAGLP
jgi:uncharacterized membrane protein